MPIGGWGGSSPVSPAGENESPFGVATDPNGRAGRLFVSAGIAELKPGDDPTAFFERADEALYRAKDLGKGQVVEAPRIEAEAG